MRTSIPAVLISALLLAGCGVGEADVGADEAVESLDSVTGAEAPLLGTANGTDAADRLCHVTLRTVSRATADTGPQSACVNGKCWFVWNGTFDVSKEAVASGAKAYVLFESTAEPGHWYKATAAKVTGAATGFQRYKFKLSEHTMEAGISATGMQRTVIQLIPYVLTTDAARHFDHNRVISEFGNYKLTNGNGFGIGDDSRVCPAATSRGTIYFPVTGAPQQLGVLKAGGAVAVQYELDRMTTCRNTHNGFPAWDMTAFAKFDPSGTLASQSVRGFETNFGTPTNVSFAVPFHTLIPAASTGLQLWVQNQSGGGSTCEDWDSLGGQNYPFTVTP